MLLIATFGKTLPTSLVKIPSDSASRAVVMVCHRVSALFDAGRSILRGFCAVVQDTTSADVYHLVLLLAVVAIPLGSFCAYTDMGLKGFDRAGCAGLASLLLGTRLLRQQNA